MMVFEYIQNGDQQNKGTLADLPTSELLNVFDISDPNAQENSLKKRQQIDYINLVVRIFTSFLEYGFMNRKEKEDYSVSIPGLNLP